MPVAGPVLRVPDVFLSYSREDQAVARRVARALEQEGFGVWWDQALNAGEAFDKVTEKALDEARAVVVLWSSRSVNSRWVRAEATQALASERLVPVMIEPCRRPIMFELTHSADLSQWDGDIADDDWRLFADGLRKLVDRGGMSPSGAMADPGSATTAPRRMRRKRPSWIAVAAIAGIAALAGAFTVWRYTQQAAAHSRIGPLHVSLPFAEGPSVFPMGSRHIAISHDGSRIAFAGANRLQIRSLDSTTPVSVDARAINPFFSPDDTWLGYFAEGSLMKVPVSGGTPVPIAVDPERAAGASWSNQGWIVYATTIGLFRIAADGGKPELIAKPDRSRHERLYAWPELLPGDRAVLITVLFDEPTAPPQVVKLDLQTHVLKVVLKGGGAARYASTGHLIYAAGQALHSIHFDPESGNTTGAAIPVPDLVIAIATDNGASEYSLAGNGSLVSLAPRARVRPSTELVWVDRKGGETPLGLEPGRYGYPRISPDGKRIALDFEMGGNRDVWIWEPQRSSFTRFTNGPNEDLLPQWTLDGSRMYFTSNRDGGMDIYSQAVNGSDARLEVAAPGAQFPHAFTPDGRQLIISENFRDISVIDLGSGKVRPLLHGDAEYWLSAISPDGHWLAYESNESGAQTEIYLRPYPDVNARREKVSVNGGRYARWGASGSHELFYVSLDGAMMRADVRLEPELVVGQVSKLFKWVAPPRGISGQAYDISPVDRRFLMTRPVEAGTSETAQVSVVLNWFDELRKLSP
jgi:eukaryotic-like serine/threonine-protein kinase